jgi:hypothetical protein
MRRCLTTTVFALALAAPASALAQDNPNCPPGAWFCEEADVQPPPEAAPAQPRVPAGEAPAAQPPPAHPGRGRGPGARGTVVIPPPPPPVVVYQPVPNQPPPQVVIVAPGTYPRVQVRPVPPPPRKKKKVPLVRYNEWGLNLRLEGVMMGERNGSASDAGMGGMGLSLRYRPVPAFAIDAGLDFIAGTDFNGFDRTEVPVSLSGLIFLNPRSRVQFYFIGGADWSHASVESDRYSPLLSEEGGFEEEYSYFGGHGGIGLEFRLTRRVAINIDGQGFVRSRTDDGNVPEFMDHHGRTTNTSGGGLMRAGITFWW